MDWNAIGSRIRKQREYLGYTREQLAEILEVTPKFCSDIELGVKGMSVPTLYKISKALRLSTDYILTGKTLTDSNSSFSLLVDGCTETERVYAEELLKVFFQAMNEKQ
ncbi:helix-turn-helix domain-containing protein [Anaerotignum sp.]